MIRRPYQSKMFGEEEAGEKYVARATNRTESAEEVIKWYNQRGECSENRIKELKIGFGMERMPCGQFEANAVFFRIGVVAYNTWRLFVLIESRQDVASSSGTDGPLEVISDSRQDCVPRGASFSESENRI